MFWKNSRHYRDSRKTATNSRQTFEGIVLLRQRADTVAATTKRIFKVKTEAGSGAMGKVYQTMDNVFQMLMQFKPIDMNPVGDLTLTTETYWTLAKTGGSTLRF